MFDKNTFIVFHPFSQLEDLIRQVDLLAAIKEVTRIDRACKSTILLNKMAAAYKASDGHATF